MTPEFCAYRETVSNHGHPYLLQCILPVEHGLRHQLVPAHRLMWENVHGTPPPARVAHLRPLDSDWTNLAPDNWEVVSFKQTRRESADKRRGISASKHCKVCGAYLLLSEFESRRNVCKECWKERLRKNEVNRRRHVKEFNCHLVDGQHFHVLDYGSAMDYLFYRLHRRLREENPDPIRYRQAVSHFRTRLHRAVQLGQEEK